MQRLKSRADREGADFNFLLVRYANERLLYRLAQSAHADQFTLKGATLFVLWESQPHRPTRDIDLLGYGDDSAQRMRTVFAELCLTEVEADGLTFMADSVTVSDIREGQAYQGKRVELAALLGKARIRVQIDVAFGDALAIPAATTKIPTLLEGMPGPTLRAYPAEAVIAEKVQAMVALGMINSRMKDLFDVLALSERLDFDGSALLASLKATFARRGTVATAELPVALTAQFATDPAKVTQWRAFLSRNRLPSIELSALVAGLADFIGPPYMAMAGSRPFEQEWPAGGGWH
jgi:predicted nucleotidyltransferase component of viral defense system